RAGALVGNRREGGDRLEANRLGNRCLISAGTQKNRAYAVFPQCHHDGALRDQANDFSRPASIGRVRMRLPVAAKIALVTAGATAAVGASPIPPGGSALFTRCVSITGA